jgi:hypothetical protein
MYIASLTFADLLKFLVVLHCYNTDVFLWKGCSAVVFVDRRGDCNAKNS